MPRSLTALFCLLCLASCGADSAPQPPAAVTLSGTASAGVVTQVN